MTDRPSSTLDDAAIVLFGLGSLGSLVLRSLTLDHPRLGIVAAVDHAEGKAGRLLGELYPDLRESRDVRVAASLEEALQNLARGPDLFIHMTESKLAVIEDQLAAPLARGLNVISASEAVWHPFLRFPDVAKRLDALARAHGVTISGCGINPGFVYDSLPLLLARTTGAVRSIAITRTIDVTGTGPGDIEHVGYGLTPAEFSAGIEAGRIVGHMGAPESLAMLAERLGLPLDRIDEEWSTETADAPVDSGTDLLGMIAPGRVVGITQYCRGFTGAREIISTCLKMYYRPERFGLTEADTITIEGSLPVNMKIEPAIASLFGAANVITSLIRNVIEAPPGLVNPLDLPVAGGRRGGWTNVLDPTKGETPGRIWIAAEPRRR